MSEFIVKGPDENIIIRSNARNYENEMWFSQQLNKEILIAKFHKYLMVKDI